MTKPAPKKRERPRKNTKTETLYRVVWIKQNFFQRVAQWLRSIVEAIWFFPSEKYPDLVRTSAPLPTSWLANTNWTVSWDDEQNPNR